jgi:hypothetical protein
MMEGKEYSEGYYAYRPPGMIHGAMEILDNDTVVLVMLSGPLDYNEVKPKQQEGGDVKIDSIQSVFSGLPCLAGVFLFWNGQIDSNIFPPGVGLSLNEYGQYPNGKTNKHE